MPDILCLRSKYTIIVHNALVEIDGLEGIVIDAVVVVAHASKPDAVTVPEECTIVARVAVATCADG